MLSLEQITRFGHIIRFFTSKDFKYCKIQYQKSNSAFNTNDYRQYLIIEFTSAMKPKSNKILTIKQQAEMCESFINNFQDYEMGQLQQSYQKYGNKKYLMMLQQLANAKITRFQILIEDLESFFRKQDQQSMVEGFRTNTKRYISIFSEIIGKLIPNRNVCLDPDQEIKNSFQSVLRDQRRDNALNCQENLNQSEKIPTSLEAQYDVSIVYGQNAKSSVYSISELDSSLVGSLVTVKAIVLRASEVKPELVVATYTCQTCGSENYVMVNGNVYRPLINCTSVKCKENKVSGKMNFLPGHSKFKAFQQMKVQQTTDQLIAGRVPRSFTLHLKGDLVKQASPGDVVMVQGILLPIKKMHFKKQYDLMFDCFLQVSKITREKKKYIEMNLSQEMMERILQEKRNSSFPKIFNKLSSSIAPEIFGLNYVKKALLLMMVGGVTKQTPDNVRIRGQINIALIGDPGIAKSQLLKQIARLTPRGIYTSGKGSSGVGLTAAIVSDPYSKQLSLEAGALVLADMGVCCIDEFDKMSEYDRTAIHQVMQQQTVSIAKAGITTTLNARCSILAAANPLYGRYDRKSSPHKNINMPAALLSRFDLVFIMLDQIDQAEDLKIAKHISKLHQNKRAPLQEYYQESFLRNYIAFAKTFNPTLTKQINRKILDLYLQRRKKYSDTIESDNYITLRSLLALVRLCQAMARLNFRNEVMQSDVDQCEKIIQESQRKVLENQKFKPLTTDNVSRIFELINNMCKYSPEKSATIEKILQRVIANGYSEQDLEITLKQYSELNIIMVDDGSVILIEPNDRN